MMFYALLKSLVMTVSMASLSPAGDLGTAASPTPSVQTDAVAKLPPEVRLRKLHLVRPDLIPFPISQDFYC